MNNTNLVITAVAVVGAWVWWQSRKPPPPQIPVPIVNHRYESGTRSLDIQQPKTTLAPTGDVPYAFITPQIVEAIKNINAEAAWRDGCEERFVVEDLPHLVHSVYSKQLTKDESSKIADIAVDALNTALQQEGRLVVTYVDPGVKVAPSHHIMVPFLIYDPVSNSSVKLVVTMGQLVQDCDDGPPKHAIQQLAPFNMVEHHWNQH